MAAHEGSEHAEGAEQRGIGEATLEQFRADVMGLSVQYMTGETFGLFLEMRRVRNRILAALDRRQWPRGCGLASSTRRSRPWSPSWPCRRGSAPRCRGSACPWSGPSWPTRSTGARPPPAGSTSKWPGSVPASSEVCLVSRGQGMSDRKQS